MWLYVEFGGLRMKKVLLLVMCLLVTIVVAGCGGPKNSDNSDKKTIKVGGTSISVVTYEAIKPFYEKMGYKTEFVMFDSNPVVVEAVNSGQVDIALGQHKKYIESLNKTKGMNLAMVKPYGYYTGIGLYSEKYKSIDEIPQNGQIAIMNDPMNMAIALRILQDAKLIKLKDGVAMPTIVDIVENPKNLKIIDMDQAQTVASLKDLDAACVFFTHMSNAKKDPKTYLLRDKEMVNIPMGVIVRADNVEAKWAVDFAKCFKEKGVQKYIDDKFPGVFEFYTDDSQVKE